MKAFAQLVSNLKMKFYFQQSVIFPSLSCINGSCPRSKWNCFPVISVISCIKLQVKTKTVDKKKKERKTKENESALRGGERKSARHDCHRAATPARREANESSCAGWSHLLLLFCLLFLIPPFKEEVDLKNPEIRLEAPGIVLQKIKAVKAVQLRTEVRPCWPRCVLASVMNCAQCRPLGVGFVSLDVNLWSDSVWEFAQPFNVCRAIS